MSYIEESIKKFQELPAEIKNAVGDEKSVNFISLIEKKYELGLKLPVILIAIKELDLRDLEEYIILKYGKTYEEAVDIKKELVFKVFQPILDYLYPDKDSARDLAISITDEEKILTETFQENLADIISGKEAIDIGSLNIRLVGLMLDEKNFKVELEKAIYKNREKLTHKTFTLEDKPHAPSIGNWLSDFIKWHGTEPFDSVVLSQYLTTSENVRRLDEKEKESVKKLLQLYRNIKFFPASMPTDDGEGWEIIPTGEEIEKLSKARPVSGPPKTEEEREEDELKAEEEQYGEGTLEREAIEEELDKKKKVRELEIVAEHYKQGSLERRALEEEIEKLGGDKK